MGKVLEVTLEPSETQEEFIRSTVLENCMMGPWRGENGLSYHGYDVSCITSGKEVSPDSMGCGKGYVEEPGTYNL